MKTDEPIRLTRDEEKLIAIVSFAKAVMVLSGLFILIGGMFFTYNAALAQPTGLIINGQGTATLSWNVPTTRGDGTALPQDEIEGYALFWGDASRFNQQDCVDASSWGALSSSPCYANGRLLDDASATSDDITLTLDSNTTLYFAMVVIDTEGRASPFSNEVAKIFTVQVDEPPVQPPVVPSDVEVNVQFTCTTNNPQINCTITVQ